MGIAYNPRTITDGLVLCLDAANFKSFKGEATTNYYSTPETLTAGRSGSTDGTIKTDYTSGGPTGGAFTRIVRNTSVSRTTDWEWQIDYSNTGLSLNNTFVVSFYARCPNGTLSGLKISNPDVQGQEFSIDSTWRRFTASFTYGAQSGLTFFRFNRGYPTFSSVNGATYDLANIQIEAKSYSTTFTTGTRGTTVATGGGWADLTGRGNNGELINGVRESSANGGSIVFDGTNDYVGLGTSTSLVPPYVTASLFVYLNSYSTRPHLFGRGEVGIGHFYFVVETSGVFRFYTDIGSGWSFIQPSSFTFPIGTWYNIVGTFDGSNVNVYGNGSLLATQSRVGQLRQYTALETELGRILTSFNLNGNISQASIYNRALTAAEVQQNFNALRGRFSI
jgi:hypothetical protein